MARRARNAATSRSFVTGTASSAIHAGLPPGALEIKVGSMRRDHYVKFCPEEEIARLALCWRNAGDIKNLGYFNIIDFVENVLSKQFTRKGILKIILFEGSPTEESAYVTYKPVTLHVDSEMWNLAKLGEPASRHIIAHEIGHIILHDHYARPFSSDPSENIRFAQKEHSAEWQANIFAGYFLLPDHIVQSFGDPHGMAANCAVPEKLAQERTATFIRANRKAKNFEGDVCTECGNFTLIRKRTSLKCDTCGATTGCS
jgi:hypothetical protein